MKRFTFPNPKQQATVEEDLLFVLLLNCWPIPLKGAATHKDVSYLYITQQKTAL